MIADGSCRENEDCRSVSQHINRMIRTPENSQVELSFSSDHNGCVKVADAIEMCKAQLLKQSVESPSQSASFQHAENTCL